MSVPLRASHTKALKWSFGLETERLDIWIIVVPVQLLSCLTLCNPVNCSTSGSSILHHLPKFAKCPLSQWCPPTTSSSFFPLLLLPSNFPTIKVFSNELTLPIRRPKYWSCSFSISLPNLLSGLMSFKIDWFDLLTVQLTLSLLNITNWKHQFFGPQPSFKDFSPVNLFYV